VALGDELVCIHWGVRLGGNLGVPDCSIRGGSCDQFMPSAHVHHDFLVGPFFCGGSQGAVRRLRREELERSCTPVHTGGNNSRHLYTLGGLIFCLYRSTPPVIYRRAEAGCEVYVCVACLKACPDTEPPLTRYHDDSARTIHFLDTSVYAGCELFPSFKSIH
jgi:hypothetical protein